MSNILVVDDEAVVRVMVSKLLAREGFGVTAVASVADAQTKLKEPFDLVVTDIMMPGRDGWWLARWMRTTPSTMFMPIIFLTALDSEQDRIKGFRMGADDYISKGEVGTALVMRIHESLRRAEGLKKDVHAALANPVSFQGQLAQIGLATVLTIFEMEKRSGRLVIVRERDSAQIYVKKGRCVYAVLSGDAAASGPDVLFQCMKWGQGEFFFNTCEVTYDDEIGLSTQGLLMEAARRMDEDNSKH